MLKGDRTLQDSGSAVEAKGKSNFIIIYYHLASGVRAKSRKNKSNADEKIDRDRTFRVDILYEVLFFATLLCYPNRFVFLDCIAMYSPHNRREDKSMYYEGQRTS